MDACAGGGVGLLGTAVPGIDRLAARLVRSRVSVSSDGVREPAA
ncbi:hypothetical protein L083_5362 [Actinoplanes sp. N902-109]|nr:hypothetical protein L083_5362 [Actinoplanes sp. N902-109]